MYDIRNRSIRKGDGLAPREVIAVGSEESFKGKKKQLVLELLLVS